MNAVLHHVKCYTVKELLIFEENEYLSSSFQETLYLFIAADY